MSGSQGKRHFIANTNPPTLNMGCASSAETYSVNPEYSAAINTAHTSQRIHIDEREDFSMLSPSSSNEIAAADSCRSLLDTLMLAKKDDDDGDGDEGHHHPAPGAKPRIPYKAAKLLLDAEVSEQYGVRHVHQMPSKAARLLLDPSNRLDSKESGIDLDEECDVEQIHFTVTPEEKRRCSSGSVRTRTSLSKKGADRQRSTSLVFQAPSLLPF